MAASRSCRARTSVPAPLNARTRPHLLPVARTHAQRRYRPVPEPCPRGEQRVVSDVGHEQHGRVRRGLGARNPSASASARTRASRSASRPGRVVFKAACYRKTQRVRPGWIRHRCERERLCWQSALDNERESDAPFLTDEHCAPRELLFAARVSDILRVGQRAMRRVRPRRA
jgi:hypothetical protein